MRNPTTRVVDRPAIGSASARSIPREGIVPLTTHRWNVQLAVALLTVQMLGSTGAITTIEYESGALSDLRHALDLLAPVKAEYAHNARWGDGNGFSHVRSALLKTSLSVPVVDGGT